MRKLIKQKKYDCHMLFWVICGICLLGLMGGASYFKNAIAKDASTIQERGLIFSRPGEFRIVLFAMVKENLSLVLFAWLIGLSMVGVVFYYGWVFYEGFCYGVTISWLYYFWHVKEEMASLFWGFYLATLFYFLAMIFLCCAGTQLVKSFCQNHRLNYRDFIDFSMKCLFSLIPLITSSIIYAWVASENGKMLQF